MVTAVTPTPEEQKLFARGHFAHVAYRFSKRLDAPLTDCLKYVMGMARTSPLSPGISLKTIDMIYTPIIEGRRYM